MNLEMTANSKSIGIRLSGLLAEVLMRRKTLFTYSHKFYLRDKYLTNHWVGNSKMKPIDVDELF